jgi:hypothetical protein
MSNGVNLRQIRAEAVKIAKRLDAHDPHAPTDVTLQTHGEALEFLVSREIAKMDETTDTRQIIRATAARVSATVAAATIIAVGGVVWGVIMLTR